jgi:hypothetical protein
MITTKIKPGQKVWEIVFIPLNKRGHYTSEYFRKRSEALAWAEQRSTELRGKTLGWVARQFLVEEVDPEEGYPCIEIPLIDPIADLC